MEETKCPEKMNKFLENPAESVKNHRATLERTEGYRIRVLCVIVKQCACLGKFPREEAHKWPA